MNSPAMMSSRRDGPHAPDAPGPVRQGPALSSADTARAEVLQHQHDCELWKYRVHNARDHCVRCASPTSVPVYRICEPTGLEGSRCAGCFALQMRGTFNDFTRVADELNSTPGLQDNTAGMPRVAQQQYQQQQQPPRQPVEVESKEQTFVTCQPGVRSNKVKWMVPEERLGMAPMIAFYSAKGKEPRLDLAYVAQPMYYEQQLHRSDPQWVEPSSRRDKKKAAEDNGTTHGNMRIPPSKVEALGFWVSGGRARAHYGADIAARGDWGAIWPEGWDPQTWDEERPVRCKRLNYVTRDVSGPQFPTIAFIRAMWKAKHPHEPLPEVQYMDDIDGNAEVFHVSPRHRDGFYQPAFDELKRQFASTPQREAFVVDGAKAACVLNGVPLCAESLIRGPAEPEDGSNTRHKPREKAPVEPAKIADTPECPERMTDDEMTELKQNIEFLAQQHGSKDADGDVALAFPTIGAQLRLPEWSGLRQLAVKMCTSEESYDDWAQEFDDGDADDCLDANELLECLGSRPTACKTCRDKCPCNRRPIAAHEWVNEQQLSRSNMAATRNGFTADALAMELQKRDDAAQSRPAALSQAYQAAKLLSDNDDPLAPLKATKLRAERATLLIECAKAESGSNVEMEDDGTRPKLRPTVEGSTDSDAQVAGRAQQNSLSPTGAVLLTMSLASVEMQMERPEWAGVAPEWLMDSAPQPGTVRIASIDDRSDYKPPVEPNDVPGLLPRIPVHVNGFYDLSTQLMYSMLTEAGSGSKDSDSVIDESLINLMTTMGPSRPQVRPAVLLSISL